jgi:hypothetical protein
MVTNDFSLHVNMKNRSQNNSSSCQTSTSGSHNNSISFCAKILSGGFQWAVRKKIVFVSSGLACRITEHLDFKTFWGRTTMPPAAGHMVADLQSAHYPTP